MKKESDHCIRERTGNLYRVVIDHQTYDPETKKSAHPYITAGKVREKDGYRTFSVGGIDISPIPESVKQNIGYFPLFSQNRGKTIMLIDIQGRMVLFQSNYSHRLGVIFHKIRMYH